MVFNQKCPFCHVLCVDLGNILLYLKQISDFGTILVFIYVNKVGLLQCDNHCVELSWVELSYVGFSWVKLTVFG